MKVDVYFGNIIKLIEYDTNNDISNIRVGLRGNFTNDVLVNNIDILKKIQKLNCEDSEITEIPISFVNLILLNYCYTKIKMIPKELVCMRTQIIEIPKELINLITLYCPVTNITNTKRTY